MPNDKQFSSISGAKWLLLSTFIVFFDQLTKMWAMQALKHHQPKMMSPVINMYLDFNKGAAFSMLNSNPTIAMWLFGSIAMIVSVVLVIWLLFVPTYNQLQSAALALILGGAVGNLIDRVRLGHVVDFVQLHVEAYYWPTFNLADSVITLGAALLVLSMFQRKQ